MYLQTARKEFWSIYTLRKRYLCAGTNLPFHQLGRARTVFVFPQNFDTDISKKTKKHTHLLRTKCNEKLIAEKHISRRD